MQGLFILVVLAHYVLLPGVDALLVHHVKLLVPTENHVCRMRQQHALVCLIHGVIQLCLRVKNVPVMNRPDGILHGTEMDVV